MSYEGLDAPTLVVLPSLLILERVEVVYKRQREAYIIKS